ncbi:DinB family protein [Maribacter sp. PR1]|uniref:DinB family protein n=1 Tax=Maribacter cobaltidurans TaxID=1178778 RepID=A0ABU7IZV1_9FLAO|nr:MULTISPECIES: DinB family protein [Maribacter]MDC6390919.1 DinB family protein [Maribacter sp. PR1]MEE1978311.1 DinB family protein [Maribacter cobaltidurans]
MKAFFHELFDYNFFCNKRIIDECVAMQQVPDKTQELFSHILNAHHIWNARILMKTSEFNVWDRHNVKDWSDIHYENQRTSFEITTNADGFDKRIDYENSEGRLFTNTLQDILFHIINHSTNHRGQIAMDFRKNDIEPIVLDYVFYKR